MMRCYVDDCPRDAEHFIVSLDKKLKPVCWTCGFETRRFFMRRVEIKDGFDEYMIQQVMST